MDKLLPDLSGYQTNNDIRVSARDGAGTFGLILPRPQPSSAAMAAASMGFSTIDALQNLATSVPNWNQQLDNLNGQIADRQAELARLDERGTSLKSLRNKGSTESLRPKEGNENPFHSDEDDNILKQPQINEPNTPRQSTSFDSPRQNTSPTSPSAERSKTKPPHEFQLQTPSPKAHSNPRQFPGTLPRQSGQPTPPSQSTSRPPPAAVLRKRKTDSLVSGESAAPKYRTRSMIIVYYDSAVQTAFEELVKFISASRNAMRKGKMAAKMAEIQRAVESEADQEAESEEGEDLDGVNFKALRGPLRAARDKVTAHGLDPGTTSSEKRLQPDIEKLSQIPNATLDLSPDPSADPDLPMPKLRFVSTRRMGPTRDGLTSTSGASPLPGQRLGGMLQGFRRGGMNDVPDIFDELDTGLEYCQVQCERAAHQFLRDGECATEVENIKGRLREVKSKAEKEIEKLKSSGSHAVKSKTNSKKEKETDDEEASKNLEAAGNGITPATQGATVDDEKDDMLRQLEVDDVEVDGDEEIEVPQLVWKKARDMVH
ncbi:hypothetical protein B7463_g3435, partial [Scytalidium lignicola]